MKVIKSIILFSMRKKNKARKRKWSVEKKGRGRRKLVGKCQLSFRILEWEKWRGYKEENYDSYISFSLHPLLFTKPEGKKRMRWNHSGKPWIGGKGAEEEEKKEEEEAEENCSIGGKLRGNVCDKGDCWGVKTTAARVLGTRLCYLVPWGCEWMKKM